MRLTSPTEVRAWLARMDFKPSRVLGQNFLVDANILRILLDAADVTKDDTVLEIGPGLGVLTGPLLERAGRVVAIEKDARLHAHLAETLGGAPNLALLHADALDVLTARRARTVPPADGTLSLTATEPAVRSRERERAEAHGSLALPATGGAFNKVVANLPYSVGSRILVELFQPPYRPDIIVVTVQREVADRLAARPGTKDYGVLGIFAQLDYDVAILKKISRTCFVPPPQVESAIVALRRRARREMELHDERDFRSLVKACFSHRRKQLGSLAGSEALARAGIDPTRRPETLSVAEWCALANAAAPV